MNPPRTTWIGRSSIKCDWEVSCKHTGTHYHTNMDTYTIGWERAGWFRSSTFAANICTSTNTHESTCTRSAFSIGILFSSHFHSELKVLFIWLLCKSIWEIRGWCSEWIKMRERERERVSEKKTSSSLSINEISWNNLKGSLDCVMALALNDYAFLFAHIFALWPDL